MLRKQRFESEQLRLLGSAIYVSGQGIAILTPAVEAVGPRVSFVNDGFCALYGRDREEITAYAFRAGWHESGRRKNPARKKSDRRGSPAPETPEERREPPPDGPDRSRE